MSSRLSLRLFSALAATALWSCTKPIKTTAISPQGDLDEVPGVVRFQLDTPLYEPTAALPKLPTPKVLVTPAVPFRVAITSPTSVDVAFAGSLAPASDYTVTLSGGLETVDGKGKLKEDAVAKFRTPRNALESISSNSPDGEADESMHFNGGKAAGNIGGLGVDQPLTLKFRYPVSPEHVKKLVSIVVEDGKDLSINLSPKDHDGSVWRLEPLEKWPRDTPLRLTVAKGLSVDIAGAGPLQTEQPQQAKLHTWGPIKFTLGRMTGAECVSPKVIPIAFNNPIACETVAAALRLKHGETEFHCLSNKVARRIRIEAKPPLPGGREVTLLLDKGIKDNYGEVLGTQAEERFKTCVEGAAFAFQKPFVILDPGQSATHVERVSGADALKVDGRRLGLPELWALLRTQELSDQVAWTYLPWWLSDGYYDEWEGEEGGGDHEDRKLPGEMATAAIEELKSAPSVTVPITGTPAVTHGKTEWRDVSVDLEQFLGGKHGLVLIRTTPMMKNGDQAAMPVLRVVNVTDIGLTARLSRDTLVVMAARYSDAKPIEGVEISLQTEDGQAVGKGVTGADGLVSLPAANITAAGALEKAPLLISAKKGDDESFLWTRFVVHDYQWDRNEKQLLGTIYPDRGIYRPGEKVHLHGVVRHGAAGGFSTPVGQKVRLTIRAPDYSELRTTELTVSEFGSFSDELELPATAKLGDYEISLTLNEVHLRGTPFRVGDYRRAEMKVEVHVPSAVSAKEKLRSVIQGDYLFGAPAAGRDLRWSLVRSTQAYKSTRFPNAVFWSSDRDEWWQRQEEYILADGTATLDEHGTFNLVQPLNLPGPLNQHEKLTVNASIEDANGQTVGTQENVDLFNSKVLVGIERPSYLAPVKKPTEVTLVAVNRDDTPAANTEVTLKTHLQGWRAVRRQGPSGGVYWQSERVDTGEKQQCKGRTDESGRLRCTINPDMGGDLRLTVEAKDGTGNARAAAWIWVYGDDDYWTEASDRYEAQVMFDRPEVNAGETARVAITSPFREGYALVTVEREDVLWKKAFPIGTSGTVEIPTEVAWAPNVHVMVNVVRARVASGHPDPEHDKPAYASGHGELKVRSAAHALNVQLAVGKPQLEPGQQQTVTATVTRSDGAPSPATEVNLWAVDEGVLMLTSYKTPDLLASMSERRGWKTLGLDTRQYILGKRIFIEPVVKGEEDGGGGGDDEDRVRKNFDPLAVWVGSAVTNDKGVVETSFAVPDTLTTYRVMATAVSKDDRFGRGDTQFKVNKTLMLRQALPRFSRAGDSFTAGVLVNTLVAAPTEVTVRLDAFDEKLFTVTGPRELTVTVKPNESKAALFQFKANDAVGASELRFAASMPDHKDRVELKLPVIRLIPREAVAASGVVASGTFNTTLNVPPDASPVAFEVNASGMPISALEGRLRDMIDYPYGCLEQRTSKILPLVAIRELGEKLAMKSIPTEKIRGWVAEWVNLVPRYRCSDGGFDYWPGCNFGSSTYLTSFALDGLLTVKRYGFDVPEAEITRTTDYLRQQVQAGSLGKDQYGSHGHNAGGMMSPLRVLAQAGTPLPQIEKASFDNRGSFPLFAKAELTRAMGVRLGKGAGDDANVKTLLQEIGARGREKDGGLTFDAENPKDNWWAWESEQHNTALVLRTLLQVAPADGRVPLLIKGLVNLNNASPYYVTADTTETLLGLVEAVDQMKLGSNGAQATIKAGGQTLATTKNLGAREETFPLTVDQIRGQIPLEITSTGKDPVFFGAFLTYSYPPGTKLPAVSNGFTLKRSYATQKGAELSPKNGLYTVRAGDIITVSLEVTVNDEGRIVVIEDPLPAGLEAIDTALATAPRTTARDDDNGRSSDVDEEGWESTYQRELHSDRTEWHFQSVYRHTWHLSYQARAVTPGSYYVPGAHAERMYQPTINGRSESCQFTVLPKQ